MDENEVKEVQDASPEPEDVDVDSSPQEQEVEEQVDEVLGEETPLPTQGLNQVPYDRFKEVIDEKNEYKNKLLELVGRQPQQPQAPQQDPYAGYDRDTRIWLQERDKQVEQLIEKKLTSTVDAQYRPIIDSLYAQLASIKEKEFRKDFPDIQPNSREEQEIAGFISAGLPANKAYWAVMGEKRADVARTSAQVKQKQKVQQKVKANLESGIAQGSPVAPKETLTFEQKFEKLAKEGGYDI